MPDTDFVVLRSYPVLYRVYEGTSTSPIFLNESQEIVAVEAHNVCCILQLSFAIFTHCESLTRE